MTQKNENAVNSDSWLRLYMKIGLPLAIISIVSLWLGYFMGIPDLWALFILTGAMALLMGVLYNVRFLMLSARRGRENSD